jgi:uncharacterized membrane protein YkvA (DUF1232 family)
MEPPTGWKQRTKQLKIETYALYLAYKDPRTPWYAKIVTAGVIAYALSPIDLIPDFIPILGYLDDLILLPLGVILVLKLIPPPVLAECRAKARPALDRQNSMGRLAAVIIGAVWLVLVGLIVAFIIRLTDASF